MNQPAAYTIPQFCLTPSFSRDYAFQTSANSEAEIGVSEEKADSRHAAFFTSVKYEHTLYGWFVRGSRETRRFLFPGTPTLHDSARPIGVGSGELKPLEKGVWPMRHSKRAPAHKFIVISATPMYTDYTGTKEELISLGLALDHHFPVARKRVVYSSDLTDNPSLVGSFRIAKIKGGRFELRIWHKYRAPSETLPLLKKFEIRYKPGIDAKYEWNKYEWALWQGRKFVLDEDAEQEISDVLWSLLETLKHIDARARKNPSYLKLVEPMTATGGK